MFSDTPLEQIHEEIKVLFSSLQFGVSLIVIKPVLFFWRSLSPVFSHRRNLGFTIKPTCKGLVFYSWPTALAAGITTAAHGWFEEGIKALTYAFITFHRIRFHCNIFQTRFMFLLLLFPDFFSGPPALPPVHCFFQDTHALWSSLQTNLVPSHGLLSSFVVITCSYNLSFTYIQTFKVRIHI